MNNNNLRPILWRFRHGDSRLW